MSSSEPRTSDTTATHSAREPQPQQDSTQAAQQAQRKLRDRLLLALAGISGYIDALSYVALGQIFAANLTGTTVLLGLNLAQGNALFVLRACASLGGFLAGVGAAALLTRRRASGVIWPRSVTVALAVEVGVLLIFSALGLTLGMSATHGSVYALIGLAACAMGVQSVAVRALGVADITTTYITGTWIGLLSGLARHLRAEVETPVERQPSARAALHPQGRDAQLLLVYVVSAALCGVVANFGARWMLIPLTPALAAVLVAARGFHEPPPQEVSAPETQESQESQENQ